MSTTPHEEAGKPPGTDRPSEQDGVPVQIRPAVAIVLILGALCAVASLILDLSPAVRYGIVGAMAVLYFLTKVKYWL
ncbi:MAG TPA: hypothetical protein VFD92_06545 [Candidatus Binatia bacterium]|nr:hypothetical protein [Candidatus Binatia bacterium]